MKPFITITLSNQNRPKEVLIARLVPGSKTKYRTVAKARNEVDATTIAEALNLKEERE